MTSEEAEIQFLRDRELSALRTLESVIIEKQEQASDFDVEREAMCRAAEVLYENQTQFLAAVDLLRDLIDDIIEMCEEAQEVPATTEPIALAFVDGKRIFAERLLKMINEADSTDN